MKQLRKNLMRMGNIVREEFLNKDEYGNKLPKRERGYSIKIIVNGHRIYAADTSAYEAYKGAIFAAKWATEQIEGDVKING